MLPQTSRHSLKQPKIVRSAAEGESGLRAAEHQPHLAADSDPAGQEGEGPGVRAGRGEGGAAPEGVHYAGRNSIRSSVRTTGCRTDFEEQVFPRTLLELDGESMVTPTAFRCGHVTKGCSTLVHQGAEMSLENVPATIRIQLTRPYLFDGGLSMRRWMRSDGKWNM